MADTELVFMQNGILYHYTDINTFLNEYADGNYFVSNKAENVVLNGQEINVKSLTDLAIQLDKTDKYKFRETVNGFTCCIPEPEKQEIDVKSLDYDTLMAAHTEYYIRALTDMIQSEYPEFDSEMAREIAIRANEKLADGDALGELEHEAINDSFAEIKIRGR